MTHYDSLIKSKSLNLTLNNLKTNVREMTKYQIICHGGAWSIPDDLEVASANEIQQAANAGLTVLAKGGTAEDAVIEAVTFMENSPTFNAGVGACLTRAGTVELDSMVMRSRDLEIGSVAAVRKVFLSRDYIKRFFNIIEGQKCISTGTTRDGIGAYDDRWRRCNIICPRKRFLVLISDWSLFRAVRTAQRTKTFIFKGWNWSKKQVL